MKFKRRPTIGLALSGGSAKGFAHIGVLKVLEDARIPIDYIAGTSMGSMVAAFYASGRSIAEIERIAVLDRKQLMGLLDPTFKSGVLAGNKVQTFLESYLEGATFDNTKIPLRIMATNVRTGDPVVLSSGNLVPAVRASISLPFIFHPVQHQNMLLADGGLATPVPARTVRQMGADVVIAVNVLANLKTIVGEGLPLPGPLGMADVSIDIMMHNLAKDDAEDADIVIAPNIGHYVSHRFDQGTQFIDIGASATRAVLPEIKESIASRTTLWQRFVSRF